MQFNYYNRKVVLLLALVSLLVQCEVKLNPPNTAIVKTHAGQNEDSVSELPADFGQFYNRFHTDDNYQLEHITWPLSGKVEENDDYEIVSTSQWNREEWTLHRKMPADGAYDLIYKSSSPEYVQEIIMNRLVGHGLIRRWRKINGEWFLSFYSGMLSAETLEKL